MGEKMKTKIKNLLNLIKDNDGRGVAVFFKKEKDTAQIDDVVKIRLPHNFVYSFHGTKIEKVKDKEKSFTIKGFYYENDNNDGFIKIKFSLKEPSVIFNQLSENEWSVKTILIDKDSIGVIASDANDNLIALVEKNQIKKVKEKKIKQRDENSAPDEIPDVQLLTVLHLKSGKRKVKKESPTEKIVSSKNKEVSDKAVISSENNVSYADINKPNLNLEKVKEVLEQQKKKVPTKSVKKAPVRKSTKSVKK